MCLKINTSVLVKNIMTVRNIVAEKIDKALGEYYVELGRTDYFSDANADRNGLFFGK